MVELRSATEGRVSNCSHMTTSCTTICWCGATLACVKQYWPRGNLADLAKGCGTYGRGSQ